VSRDLPAGWTIRRPTLADVPEILAVVHASDIAAVGEPDFTADEVREILTGPNHDPERDSWLAIDATGRIAAWAYLDNSTASERDNLDVYVHPEFHRLAQLGRPVQARLVDLVVARVAERAAAFGYPRMSARAGAIATETPYIEVLTAAGFGFIKRYARMKRALTGAESPPDLPPDLVIRNVRPDDDEDMRTFHRILEGAFKDLPDYLPFDYESYRARLDSLPSITWDEWYVAELDGVPAGILQSADQSREQNEGWVKNLAVEAEYRGRGIGAALLRTAFATYAAKGLTAAGLGVDMTNPTGAYSLYEGVGMRAAYEADMFERTVDAA